MSGTTSLRTCACPPTADDRMCVNGLVYGPCWHPHCSGVCEFENRCPCHLHVADPTHEAPPQYWATADTDPPATPTA